MKNLYYILICILNFPLLHGNNINELYAIETSSIGNTVHAYVKCLKEENIFERDHDEHDEHLSGTRLTEDKGTLSFSLNNLENSEYKDISNNSNNYNTAVLATADEDVTLPLTTSDKDVIPKVDNEDTSNKTSDVYADKVVTLSSVTKANGSSKIEIQSNCNHIEIDSENGTIGDKFEKFSIAVGGTLKINGHLSERKHSLKSVHISARRLLVLPNNCKSWLPNSVTNLDLSYSFIKHLQLNCQDSSLQHLIGGMSDSFDTVSLCTQSLNVLTLTWSSMYEIESSCDGGTAQIALLNLERNKLQSFSTCGWPSLKELDLNSNNITMVDLDGKCRSPHLSAINLSGNHLTETPLAYPKALTKIDMSHNKISFIHPFNHMIQEVDLSYNALTSIGKGLFKKCWMLKKLDLSHNHIRVIYGHAFIGVRELRSLDLSHNVINHVRHEALTPLRNLEFLNIEHNQLRKMDARLFVTIPRKMQFQVRHNPWRCNCHLLAKLKATIRNHCMPDCKKMTKLQCLEGSTLYNADVILQQCIDVVNDIKPSTSNVIKREPVHHPIYASDEDSSEENTSEDSTSTSMSSWSIAGVVILLLLPIMGLAVKKMYHRRKKFYHYFNCLAPPASTPLPQLHSMKEDTDSETEM